MPVCNAPDGGGGAKMESVGALLLFRLHSASILSSLNQFFVHNTRAHLQIAASHVISGCSEFVATSAAHRPLFVLRLRHSLSV